MSQLSHHLVAVRTAILALALIAAVPMAGAAEQSSAAKNAEKYLTNGNLKAAAIELRNAIRESPQDPLLRMRLAQVYLKLGDPISAEREARAARERNAPEADYLPVLDQALLRQGKFQELADLVRPGNRPPALESEVRWALGMAAASQHDNANARTFFQDAIRLDPNAAAPKIGMARLLGLSNPTQANQLLDQVLATNPQSVEALQVKGELARANGDVKAAQRDLDAALKINPNNVAARLSRANLYIGQGKYKEADEDLDPVLKADPNNFIANYLRALELAKHKQYASADRLLDRLSAAFDQFPTGYFIQGETKLELGQNAQAEASLVKYLDRARGDPKAAWLAAVAALRQHAPERAIGYLKPVAAQPKPAAETLTLLGNAYMAAGKPELALQQFEKAAAIEPNDPRIETRMAVSEINIGQSKEGLAELERVFGTQAGAPVAGPTLVLARLRAGQPDKADQVATALVARDPKNPLYLSLSGIVRVVKKDNAGAEAAYRAALAQDPEFATAINNLAALYLSTGRPDEAKKVYEAALAKNPNDESFLLGLANIAISQKNWAEATKYIDNARTAAPNDPAPGLARARVYALQQDWKNAAAVAGALSAQFPTDLNVMEALGQAQFASGDKKGALSSFKRAYQLAPNSTPALSRYLSLLTSQKYYREASEVLGVAIDRDPKNSTLKADLIRVTARLDGAEAAIAKANAFAKDDPSNSVYPLVAAQIYKDAGRWEDATALLQKAVAEHPRDAALSAALAELYDQTGHFDKAEALLQAELSADPKNAHATALLAALMLATGRTAAAHSLYEGLLAQKSDDVVAHLGLADVAASEKNWAEAEQEIKTAQGMRPDSVVPGLRLVNLEMMRQDWKNAIASAAELAAKFPTDVDVLDTEARAYLGSGDTAAATETYARAYQLDPASTKVLARYVSGLNSAKRYTEAEAVLRKALDRDPGNPALKADLIRVAAEAGGLEAGLAEARNLAKEDPDNPFYDVLSADLLAKAGRSKEAVGLLERDLAAKPDQDDVRAPLAAIYNRAGERDRAEALLTARLRDDPKNYPIGAALASFHLENKDYDAAIAQYNRLLQLRPADPTTLNNLAWLYQQKSELPKAREFAERALAAAPKAPEIDDTFGWIVLAQGDVNKAVMYLSAANVSAPANPSIAYHLAAALQRAGRSTDARTVLEKLLGSGVAFAEKPQAEKLLADIKHS